MTRATASPVVVTPLSASFRLEGAAGTKSSPIPNGELAKHLPNSFSTTTAVSLSASSHLTPLTTTSAGGCASSSPSPLSSSAEDLETPPLAHAVVAKAGETEEDGGEDEALPALLARVSRPPPFPLEGEEQARGERELREREPERRERELPEEPARSADDDDEASSSSSVQESLSSLALVDEA